MSFRERMKVINDPKKNRGFIIVTVNGIIVKKCKDATKILQWAIDHVSDDSFDLTDVELK